MKNVVTECLPCGKEFVTVFYDASSKKVFELDQRNHCFKFLSLNVREGVITVNWDGSGHRSFVMTSIVNLYLTMKIFSELPTCFGRQEQQTNESDSAMV